MAISISVISTVLLVTSFLPGVAAAGLNISPVNTATFSLYIVLIAYTLFQAYRAYGILQRPQPKFSKGGEPIPPERVPYAKLFIGTLTLIICYVLQTIWIPIDLSKDSLGYDVHNTFYGMLAADQLSDIFIASALLHFIDHRRDVLGRRHADDEPTTAHSISSVKKRLLDTILLSIMAAVTVVGVVVGTVVIRTISNPDLGYQIYSGLYHAYIALYIAATTNIALSAWFLWHGLPKSSASEGEITRVILYHIVPLLVLRVLFKLSVDVVTSVSSTSFDIDFDILGLIEAIVECVTYAAVLYMSLSLARPIILQKEVD